MGTDLIEFMAELLGGDAAYAKRPQPLYVPVTLPSNLAALVTEEMGETGELLESAVELWNKNPEVLADVRPGRGLIDDTGKEGVRNGN
jgi:hypothetical protein